MERQVVALLRGGQFKQILENYVSEFKSEYGLKRTEIEVLYYLSRNGERNTAKDITLSLNMNKGHLSQTAESLCQKGYVSASKDENDYRIVHYTITKDAARVTEEIDAAIDRLYNALFAGISAEDQEALKRIAAQMTYNIRQIMQEKI